MSFQLPATYQELALHLRVTSSLERWAFDFAWAEMHHRALHHRRDDGKLEAVLPLRFMPEFVYRYRILEAEFLAKDAARRLERL